MVGVDEAGQPQRHRLQERVAHRVAELIVARLEAVQVKHQDEGGGGGQQRGGKLLVKCRAVGEAGERIVLSQMLQVDLPLPPFRDVGDLGTELDTSGTRPAGQRQLDRELGAVLVNGHHVDGFAAQLGHAASRHARQPGAVLRLEAGRDDQIQRSTHSLSDGVAEQSFSGEVPEGDATVGCRGDQCRCRGSGEPLRHG